MALMADKKTVNRNVLSFSIDCNSFKKLHIDGADLYANYKVCKKFQRGQYCKNCLVMLNSGDQSLHI